MSIYHVSSSEADGVMNWSVYRFAILPEGSVELRPKLVEPERVELDRFPEKEEADGVCDWLNHRWTIFYEAALMGSASNNAYHPDFVARRAYHIATASAELL